MAIAQLLGTVIDCPDPNRLARFYAALLGWRVDDSKDWVEIGDGQGRSLGFQRVADYVPPRWPTQDVPQQMHLDVGVADLDVAEAAVLRLGATKAEHQPGTTFRVFLDPVGHPFCLCLH